MLVKVEALSETDSPDTGGDLIEYIAAEIRRQIMVRAKVELVSYGSLPRSERKSKRVFDNRTEDCVI